MPFLHARGRCISGRYAFTPNGCRSDVMVSFAEGRVFWRCSIRSRRCWALEAMHVRAPRSEPKRSFLVASLIATCIYSDIFDCMELLECARRLPRPPQRQISRQTSEGPPAPPVRRISSHCVSISAAAVSRRSASAPAAERCLPWSGRACRPHQALPFSPRRAPGALPRGATLRPSSS